VLVKAGGQQRGTGSQVDSLIYGFQISVEGFQFISLLALLKSFRSPLFPLQGIHLREQFGYFSGTDVLTYNSAVHLADAIVVASLPCHRLCYLKTIAPLTVWYSPYDTTPAQLLLSGTPARTGERNPVEVRSCSLWSHGRRIAGKKP
jgi:hypothetical protein